MKKKISITERQKKIVAFAGGALSVIGCGCLALRFEPIRSKLIDALMLYTKRRGDLLVYSKILYDNSVPDSAKHGVDEALRSVIRQCAN